jgi:hypothetical protein
MRSASVIRAGFVLFVLFVLFVAIVVSYLSVGVPFASRGLHL